MSRKNVVNPHKIFDAEDISVSATSSSTNVKKMDKASIRLDWSGSSLNGEVTVQASNDDLAPSDSAKSWYDVDMGSTITISGVSGDHLLVFNELPFSDIRLVYTSSAGTGTLTAILSAKVVGA